MLRPPSTLADLGPRSRVLSFASLPVTHAANGGEGRSVLHGLLVTGEAVSLHESMQPVGAVPNPAHVIQHTEIICVWEGALEFQHDNLSERAEAGDILFVAKGTRHAVRSAGAVPAAYFVLAIGGDVNP